MRQFKVLLVLSILFSMSSWAQQGNDKMQDTIKVEIYTSEERDNLQYWFHSKIGPMAMSDSINDRYFTVLTKYGYKIGRLNDKDKSYSNQEIIPRLDSLVKLQNAELRKILTEEQFLVHLENYKDIIYSIKTRLEKVD